MQHVLILTSNFNPDHSSVGYYALEIFLKEYRRVNPEDVYERIDLNLLEMANKTLNSQNLSEGYFTPEDSFYWIDKLKSVDKLIILSPMTNFAPAPVLRNFIDHIMVANRSFTYKYSKKGEARGLITNLKVQIITIQGAPYGWYLWGNHTEYLRGCFDFIGAEVAKPILIHSTKISRFANLTAQQMAKKFEGELKLRAREF